MLGMGEGETIVRVGGSAMCDGVPLAHLRGGAVAYGDRRRSWKVRFWNGLPEFREKGLVTIVDAVHGDRVLHSSTYIPEVG